MTMTVQLLMLVLAIVTSAAQSRRVRALVQRGDQAHHDVSFISLDTHVDIGRPKVWIQSYGRSGSSTVLSMVEVAGQNPVVDTVINPNNVFGLFEPCHEGDQLSPELATNGCLELLRDISTCDFSGIDGLWGYNKLHTTILGRHPRFTKVGARLSCQSADLVAFKTVSFGHNLTRDALPLLQQIPQLRVIDVVRDPRGIFASWKKFSMSAWSDKWVMGLVDNTEALRDICDNYAANLMVDHPRIKHIQFESLIANPELVMRDVYAFLGLEFGPRQQTWIDKVFNANHCVETKASNQDCHTNSTEPLDRWREQLLPSELAVFQEYAPCQLAAAQYGYS